MGSDKTDNRRYYAVLNVPRDASTEEIDRAYKRLARSCHPDRFSAATTNDDPRVVEQAKEMFQELHRAYEVLMNESTRRIYDVAGEAGLSSTGTVGRWFGGEPNKDWKPTETQEFVKKIQELNEIEENLRGSALAIVSKVLVDATSTVNDLVYNYNESGTLNFSGVRLPRVTDVTVSQTFQAQLSPKLVGTVQGNIQDRSTNGALGLRYSYSSATVFWGGISMEQKRDAYNRSAQQMGLTLGAQRTFSSRSGGSVQIHFTPQGPVCFASAYRNLTPTQTFKISMSSVGSIGLGHSFSHGKWSVNLKLDLDMNAISATVHGKYKASKRTSLSAGVTTAINHMEEELALSSLWFRATQSITKVTKIGLKFSITSDALVLALQAKRNRMRFEIPISYSLDGQVSTLGAAAMGSIVPLALIGIFKAVQHVYERQQEKSLLEEERERRKEELANAKISAEVAGKLMGLIVSRKRQSEEAKNGLVIVQAYYGVLPQDKSSIQLSEKIIDVTIPVQNLVEDSKVRFFENMKSDLIGFYDCAFGEPKELYIEYLFRNKLHQVTIPEDVGIQIPRQGDLRSDAK